MPGRKKQDRTSVHARVASSTPERVREIALKMGLVYDGEGSIGSLLDAIAQGDVILISTNKPLKSG